MVRHRTALRFVLLLDVRQLHPGGHVSGGDLAGLKGQLQLLGGLQRRAKPLRSLPCQLMAQLLDQDRLRHHLGQKPRGEAPQLLGAFRQGQGLIEHARSLSHCIPCGNHGLRGWQIIPLPGASRHAAVSASQSLPAASTTAQATAPPSPPVAESQTKRPFSKRIKNMQAP